MAKQRPNSVCSCSTKCSSEAFGSADGADCYAGTLSGILVRGAEDADLSWFSLVTWQTECRFLAPSRWAVRHVAPKGELSWLGNKGVRGVFAF